jgi:hypothetical protein
LFTTHPRPPRRQWAIALVALLIAIEANLGIPVVTMHAESAQAASGQPLAVVVVGPAAGKTSQYRLEAAAVVKQLRAYGARVVEVYSPSATWTQVKSAARGAHLFVYLGQGRGHPGPYGRFNPNRMDGLGLNRSADSGNANVVFYGESYVRNSLDLAAGAVVILRRVPYAAGSSEPGRAYPSARTAIQRADNYAAGFLDAGAAAVFASDRSVGTVVRDLFKTSLTMRAVFWGSPHTSTRYDAVFRSKRTAGAIGILAPYSPGRYFQSVVGRLHETALDWRRSWDASIPPPASSSVRVTSVPALLNALAKDSVTDIVVANGTYHVSRAASKESDSLWIGSRFAGRTRPVTVRAETTGGVTFDGGGTGTFGGITFAAGAHHQTWRGFTFANGKPTATGVIVFGGYAGLAAPHHITLRDITIPRSVTTTSSGATDHGVYFSKAVDGPHDILIDGLNVDGAGGLDSALHFYHSDSANQNAWNVTVRRLRVSGTQQAIIVWDKTIRDVVIEDATITNAERSAVRYEQGGTLTLRRVTSSGSGDNGFYSSLGLRPSGVSIIESSLH